MADWTPLRHLLAEVDTSVTLSWNELDRLVGGLPRSAYVHNAFWKGHRSRWPGFTTTAVAVGEAVTFARKEARTKPREATPRTTGTPPRRKPPVATNRPTVEAATDIILIGCVKQKLPVTAAARDLYVSPLFRKGREYAEQADVPWFILSAKHGLVEPTTELEPYDLQLSKTSAGHRATWGDQVVASLAEAMGPLTGRVIEIHAGAAYADAIRDGLRDGGARVIEPLAGLQLGPRLAWYSTGTGHGSATSAEGDAQPVSADGQTIGELVDRLQDTDTVLSPAEFLATNGTALQSPGLYSWWVDEPGADDLSQGLGQPVAADLIYAGLAGATRSRSGRKSTNTLWGRIKSMHLGGKHEFSTFRLSLGSILADATGSGAIDERALTAWMHVHLRVIAVPVNDADTLGEVETDVLARLDPPLNLSKVTRDPLRTRLSALRKQYGQTRQGDRAASRG